MTKDPLRGFSSLITTWYPADTKACSTLAARDLQCSMRKVFCDEELVFTNNFSSSFEGDDALTLLCFLFNRNQWPEYFTFSWSGIFPKFQIWRLATGFLYFGALDLFYPLTLQFVWQHMSQLEKMNYKSPEDFMIMIGFGMITLITIYSLTGISMRYLGHNLATYLVYIWSRVFEGMDVNFMDLFTLKSELMPWFFVIQTFLLEQEIPFADLLGILVGHLYSYLKQKHVLNAPQGMKAFFQSSFWKDQYERFKGEFE
eukprot:gene5184-5706_t